MTRSMVPQIGLGVMAVWLGSALAFGQAAKPEKPAETVLKVYRVADLITPRPDYPYRPGLPTTTEAINSTSSSTSTPGGFGGGGMGGGIGGVSGGGGAGFFQVPDSIPRVAQFGGGMEGGGGLGGFAGGTIPSPSADESLRFSRDDLREAIVSTVSPESWEDLGGPGVCKSLGGMFLIKQTPEIHKQIEQLLSDIRTEGGGSHTVTLDALWLSLSSDDFERITAKPIGAGKPNSFLDAALLKELTAKNPSYQGRVSCYNDQAVHLASGQRRTLVLNAIPSVGLGAVGYSPVVSVPNIGLLLQVRPTVDPDRKSGVLNVTSTMTTWQDPGEPITIKTDFSPSNKEGISAPGGNTQIQLDRANLDTQHLGTTIRVPVGQPVLVGGMSSIPGEKSPPEQSSRQWFLIVKLTINEAAQ